MTKNPRRALLLDFDGTLADTLPQMWRAYCNFLARFGAVPARAEFDSLNGPPLAEIVERLRSHHRLPVTQTEGVALYDEDIDLILREARPSHGAKELLQTAHAESWRIGIVTSNTRRRVADWLEHFGLGDAVEVIVDGSTAPGKPDPVPYRAALELLGCEAAQSVAVEDSQTGYRAAASAGLQTLYYRPLDRAGAPENARQVESLPAVSAFLQEQTRTLSVRLAEPGDRDFLHALRNDPVVAANSRTARPLRSEELEDRFRLDLPLVEKAILIGEAEGLPVGMVRFDRSSSQHEVSIILAASWRGRGAAKPLLETAMDAFQAIVGPAALSAEVASENIASAALFRGCGFQLRGQVGRFLQFSLPTPP